MGCWTWYSNKTSPNGYPQFSMGGRSQGVHMWAYELTYGPIPEGLVIDHLCRVRSCCNPEHLEAVTPEENNRRTRALQCKNGHRRYMPEDVIVERNGMRRCRGCINRRLYTKPAREEQYLAC